MTNDYYTITDYPVTGKASRYYDDRGYVRLASVEVEQWFAPYDYGDGAYSKIVDFAHVAAVDVEGNVWLRSIDKGETEHQVAELLAARGYTTGDECLHSTAKGA